jgi:Tfp pilus assembly PilM family ATPase
MFWVRQSTLGIDIGSYALKTCLQGPSGKVLKVSNQVIWPERSSREYEGDQPLEQRLGQMICEAVQAAGSGKLVVRISQDHGYCSAGYLELPCSLSPSQMQVALSAAVARQLPRGLEGLEVSVLPVATLGAPDQVGRFYIATQKSIWTQLAPSLKRFGLKQIVGESAVSGLLHGLIRGYRPSPEQCWLAVEVGHRLTRVLLLRGTNPYSYRDFRLAGGDFTYAFQMGEQISWSCAESRKRAYHLEEKDFQVESFIRRWLLELRKSRDFAAQALPVLNPSQIVLTGGSALWPGLAQRLSDELGLPTQILPWEATNLEAWRAEDPRAMSLYNTALGLVCA